MFGISVMRSKLSQQGFPRKRLDPRPPAVGTPETEAAGCHEMRSKIRSVEIFSSKCLLLSKSVKI